MVAVSGGIDSMVLLDVLAHTPGLELTVAHFEHGVRADSDEDRELVQRAAEQYGLPFVFEHGNLGPNVSEAAARAARYAFLRRVKKTAGAQAIITAHHQDDLIETAIINMLRGTGRKGLNSLRSTDEIIRPLLHVTKSAVYDYASGYARNYDDHNIIWNVDSTNNSDRYLRNYIRRHLIKYLGETGRELLLGYIEKATTTNPLIDSLLLHEMNDHSSEDGLERPWFAALPHDVSREIMAAWLRQHEVREMNRKLIERLVVAAKVAKAGKQLDLDKRLVMAVGKDFLKITPRLLSSKRPTSV